MHRLEQEAGSDVPAGAYRAFPDPDKGRRDSGNLTGCPQTNNSNLVFYGPHLLSWTHLVPLLLISSLLTAVLAPRPL